MNFIDIEIDIFLIAISLAIIYGISPLTYKYLIISNNISFETYLLLSSFILFIACIIYSLFNKKNIFKEISKINGNMLLLFIANILIISFISQILFHYGIKKTKKISLFTIIVGFYPLITMLLSLLFLKDKISSKIIIGYLISMVGIFIIFI